MCLTPRKILGTHQIRGEPQTWSRCFGEEKNLLPLVGFEPWIGQPVALSLQQWLCYPGSSCSSAVTKSVHTQLSNKLHLQKFTCPLIQRPQSMYRSFESLRCNIVWMKLITSSLTNLFLHCGPTPRIRVSPFQLHSDSPPYSQCICIPLLHGYKYQQILDDYLANATPYM